jgi:hypothetical protein
MMDSSLRRADQVHWYWVVDAVDGVVDEEIETGVDVDVYQSVAIVLEHRHSESEDSPYTVHEWQESEADHPTESNAR